MDWFERLTGFKETGYEDTQSRLELDGGKLRSKVNGKSYAIGEFEFVSLATLRERAASEAGPIGRLKVQSICGDVRAMHQFDEYGGALFQVASQFNLLEMVGPKITPEHGVTRYQDDQTQGPACAMAAGAATIFRNYFVPLGDQIGQTRDRQIDGLADVGVVLGDRLGRPIGDLWDMSNGYALCTFEGLAAIGAWLRSTTPAEVDTLRRMLRIGIHWDAEVTDGNEKKRRNVSHAYCSALPVGYVRDEGADWRPFAELVLSAAYEATLWAAVLNARRNGSRVVLLTRLGGGVFRNDDRWIDTAIRNALVKVRDFDLEVRLVSYGPPHPSMLALEDEFG